MLDITPLVRILAARRRVQLARMDAASVQERTLMKLVRGAANTRFGKDHGFAAIGSVADFQARVPLRAWEAMWNDYFKPAFPNYANVSWPGATPYLALSSGTTSSRTKHVPVTEAMNRSNSRAGFDLLVHHFAAKPRSRLSTESRSCWVVRRRWCRWRRESGRAICRGLRSSGCRCGRGPTCSPSGNRR
jgi:hypothetical protein